ncbi:hypothetical protein XELAEV_18022853mg [Xenopus laevis]|uniref:Uncharacterized protein n=1 Tax=Xenopus laevis TaxID=8355 RepID=A0A974D419_XENLA|nr:hypothetical protein XELAEV_18022853mg [Xenopus laevis]
MTFKIMERFSYHAKYLLCDYTMQPSFRGQRICSTSTPQCFRGCGEIGDYKHSWWTCPIVENYLNAIVQIATEFIFRLNYIQEMYHLTAIVKNKREYHDIIWQPWEDFKKSSSFPLQLKVAIHG